MRLITILIASAIAASPVFAQQSQRSTNAQGVQIQGNTEIKADQKNVNAVAVGEGNVAKNTAGAIKGGTQIQGNTKIKASQKNATAVAVGKGNTAANEAGVIGGGYKAGQMGVAGPRGGMSSSNEQGVQIQGNTDIKASQKNVAAVAVGEGNVAKNTAGAIKGGTQIQGNTKIKASQKNASAVAVGKGNTAANEAGQIGGK